MKVFKVKLATAALAFCVPLLAWSAPRQAVDIDVQGMACPFCAYGLSKNIGKASEVESAEASLEQKKVHITLKPGQQPNVELYKKLIHDAGFTPGEARITMEESK